MREVYNHQDSARVGYYKSVLDEAGIANFIRNDLSHNLMTGLPSPVFFPALCVLNDEDYAAALELLRAIDRPEANAAKDWRCPTCQEEVPGNFETCWKCGFEKESGGGAVDAPPSPL